MTMLDEDHSATAPVAELRACGVLRCRSSRRLAASK
jgi:hypothetical protein